MIILEGSFHTVGIKGSQDWSAIPDFVMRPLLLLLLLAEKLEGM